MHYALFLKIKHLNHLSMQSVRVSKMEQIIMHHQPTYFSSQIHKYLAKLYNALQVF